MIVSLKMLVTSIECVSCKKDIYFALDHEGDYPLANADKIKCPWCYHRNVIDNSLDELGSTIDGLMTPNEAFGIK